MSGLFYYGRDEMNAGKSAYAAEDVHLQKIAGVVLYLYHTM